MHRLAEGIHFKGVDGCVGEVEAEGSGSECGGRGLSYTEVKHRVSGMGGAAYAHAKAQLEAATCTLGVKVGGRGSGWVKAEHAMRRLHHNEESSVPP